MKKKDIIRKLLKYNLNITPKALEILEKEHISDLNKIIEHALKEDVAIITEEFLNKIKSNMKTNSRNNVVVLEKKYKRIADEYEEDIKIKKNFKKITSKADVKKFLNYFRNRYSKIKELFESRGIRSITISQAKKLKEEAYVVCCVYDIKKYSNRYIVLEVDDPTGTMSAVVKNDELYKVCDEIIKDEILCLRGKFQHGRFIVSDIIFPDVPVNLRTKTIENDIVTVFISDIHVGSNKFLTDKFQRFVRWLRMESVAKNIASRVKYIIIGGDLVDGIGVYPNQEEELKIKNIKEQYKKLYEMLKKVPEGIKIIIIPGNHDATRQAEPQPPILEEYAEDFYNDSRFVMLSNPSFISLHGIDILIYHGRSLDDIIATLPGYDYKKVDLAMTIWLKKRHLSPFYGSRVPIAPEDFDFLVIDQIPNIIHAGHVHRTAIKDYKNILLINSGTFQEQTEYQKRMNIHPTPGLVPVLFMNEMKINILQF